MDAHISKGLQLQVHCCCCTAILRSASRWSHFWARGFNFRSTAVVAQPYLGTHRDRRTYAQGTSASYTLLLFHSHTCVYIHMDAHMGKTHQLQVHCCCSTAIHVCTSTWTHKRQNTSVSGPLLLFHSNTCVHIHVDADMGYGLEPQVHCCCCTAIHMCTYKGSSTWMLCTAIHVCTSISGSGPWMLLYSHTYVHIHFRSICCCTYIAYICTPTMHAQVHCCFCTSMLYLCVHTFHVHVHGCSSP